MANVSQPRSSSGAFSITPILLTTQEAAALCRVSPNHWARLVQAKKAPQPIRMGRSVRFPREVLIRWIKEGCPVWKE